MNRSDLAECLAGRTGMSKTGAKDAVDGLFENVEDSCQDALEMKHTLEPFLTVGRPPGAGPAPDSLDWQLG